MLAFFLPMQEAVNFGYLKDIGPKEKKANERSSRIF